MRCYSASAPDNSFHSPGPSQVLHGTLLIYGDNLKRQVIEETYDDGRGLTGYLVTQEIGEFKPCCIMFSHSTIHSYMGEAT